MSALIDIAGRRFGSLVAVEACRRRSAWSLWLCRCDCGAHVERKSSELRRGRATSCGCKSCTGWRDLSGQRFGRLVALSYESGTRANKGRWLCRCDCGVTKTVPTPTLLSGKGRSCGCLRREKMIEGHAAARDDLTGKRFGRWSVLSRGPSSVSAQVRWYVKCDCGTEAVAYASNLKSGKTKSCGCLTDDGLIAQLYCKSKVKPETIPHKLVSLRRDEMDLRRLARTVRQALSKEQS